MKKITDMLSIVSAPGAGLLTVTTGSKKSHKLLKSYISEKKLKHWKAKINKSTPQIIGFPSDTGGGICRGAAHGPLALRTELYKQNSHWALNDLGDIPCIPQLLHDEMLNPRQKSQSGLQLWGKKYSQQQPVSPLNLLKDLLSAAYKKERKFRPVILGGDHSLSWAPIKALHENSLTKKLGILHLDAHTDLLEERYGVKYCFATWSAHAAKLIGNPKNYFQVGLRTSKRSKNYWQNKFGLRQIWQKEIITQKISAPMLAQKFLTEWKKNGVEQIYLSIDIDALDPKHAPCTGTPENNGMSLRYAKTLIKLCSEQFPVVGADIVEVAPVLGSPSEARKTVKSAAQLIEAIHWH